MANFGAFTAWSIVWTTAMGRACWQGSLALFLAWVLCRLLPRLPASFQCGLWRLAYLKLFVALFWATPVNLPLLPPTPTLPVPNVSGSKTESAAAFKPGSVFTSPLSSETPSFPLPVALGALWLCGMLWQSLRIWREAFRARALRRQGHNAEDAHLIAEAKQICRSLGLRRCPQLLYGGASSPLLVGVARPAILLPEGLWNDCTPIQQRLILAHELAHVRRGDLLWAWLPLAARCAFFFLPSVWLAEREWQQSQEMACDEQALRLTRASRAEYGNVLLKVTLKPRLELPSGLVAAQIAESYVTVQRRLLAMKQTRMTSRRALTLAGTLAALAGVTGIIPWRVSAQDAPHKSSGLRENPMVDKFEIPEQLVAELSLTLVQIKQAQAIHAASVKQVRSLLSLDQQKRLAELNDSKSVQMERLGLTDAQKIRLKMLKEQSAQQMAALETEALTEEEREAHRKAIAEASEVQMKQIYTPQQMQTLAEMRRQKEAGNNALDLSDAQRVQIEIIKDKTAKQFEVIKSDDSLSLRERDARMAALKLEIEKQYSQILTPEQIQRMAAQEQQAKEQDRQNRAIKEGGPYGLATLERLGTLTPTQRNRIQAIYKDMDKQMEHLLTPVQKQKLEQMRSKSE